MSTDAPLQFKVDTVADVSVVPPSFAGCPVDLDKPHNERLMGPGRCRLRLLGTFPATLSWRGRSVCKTLYVVADIDSPLLGYSAVVGTWESSSLLTPWKMRKLRIGPQR
ncbi:hypothetical protein MRX96_002039 [Rhipicephalus microplus]